MHCAVNGRTENRTAALVEGKQLVMAYESTITMGKCQSVM